MKWEEVLKTPGFDELNNSDQTAIRAHWVDNYYLPELEQMGLPKEDMEGARYQALETFDNGQGYITSFLNSGAQGALKTGTSAIQGAGVLLGSEGLEDLGTGLQQDVEDNFPVNPSLENTNFAGNVAGNVGAFIGTGSAGGFAGKALGSAAIGAEVGSLGTGFLAGAGGAAQNADQYGIEGEDRYIAALLGGATEVISEKIPFLGGMGTELKAISKIPGLSSISPKAAGGFARAVGSETVEEVFANTAGNLVTTALAPDGVETPGALSGTLKAAAGGALGGLGFGALGLVGDGGNHVANKASAAAAAAGDPAAAAVIDAANATRTPSSPTVNVQAPVITATPAGDSSVQDDVPLVAPQDLDLAEFAAANPITSSAPADFDFSGDESVPEGATAATFGEDLTSSTAAPADFTEPAPLETAPLPVEQAAEPLVEPPAPVTAPAGPTEAQKLQRAQDNQLIDANGRVTEQGATEMFNALKDLGVTTGNVVVNDTGSPEGSSRVAKGSFQNGTTYLNRNLVTADTPLHEVTHGLIPQMRTVNADLYAQGAALLQGAPLTEAIKRRYSAQGVQLSEEDLIEEALVTAVANDGAEWLKAYAGNSAAIRKIKQWLAQARVWFNEFVSKKGLDPNMTLKDFTKQVNDRILAGKLKPGTSAAPAAPASQLATTPQTQTTEAKTFPEPIISPKDPGFGEDVTRFNREVADWVKSQPEKSRLAFADPQTPGETAFVSKEPGQPGKWRATQFQKTDQGQRPVGHQTFKDRETAVKSVTSKGYVPSDARFSLSEEGNPDDVNMSLDMDKGRILKLLGERMYNSALGDVVFKEISQNSFDAIKDAEDSGQINPGGGIIEYGEVYVENGTKVQLTFADNGSGMTPEILQSAFFRVGGTHKTSNKKSGGFGLAKVGMFMSADRVYVETVKDGTVSTVDVTKGQLLGDKFKANVIKDPTRKNGTMVRLTLPTSVVTGDGKTVKFEPPRKSFKEMVFHDLKTVRGDRYHEVDVEEHFRSGFKTPNVFYVPLDSVTDMFEATERADGKKHTVVEGKVGNVGVKVTAMRIGYKDTSGNDRYSYQMASSHGGAGPTLDRATPYYLSNGLFQFTGKEVLVNPRGGSWEAKNRMPYVFVVEIDAGSVDAASDEYPFTNSREDIRDGAVKEFINAAFDTIRSREIQDSYTNEFKPMTALDGGPASPEYPVVYNNTTVEMTSEEEALMKDFSQLVFNESEEIVELLRDGSDNQLVDGDWHRVILSGERYRVGETGTIDFHVGGALSKNWAGVSGIGDPAFVLVNPVYHPKTDRFLNSHDGRVMLASYLAHIVIHEMNHTFARSEGAEFTWSLANVESFLSGGGYTAALRGRMRDFVETHTDAIRTLKLAYDRSSTKDNDAEFESKGYLTSGRESGDRPGQRPTGPGGQGDGTGRIPGDQIPGQSGVSRSGLPAQGDRVQDGAGRGREGDAEGSRSLRLGEAIESARTRFSLADEESDTDRFAAMLARLDAKKLSDSNGELYTVDGVQKGFDAEDNYVPMYQQITILDPTHPNRGSTLNIPIEGRKLPLSKEVMEAAIEANRGKFSLSATDDEYLAAVESGDEKKQQKMVDAAAKAAGYNVGPVYHSTYTSGGALPFNEFKKSNDPSGGFWFSSKDLVKRIGGNRLVSVFIKGTPKEMRTDNTEASLKKLFRMYPDAWSDAPSGVFKVQDKEFGGESYLVKDPNQIKSADPVTRDDNGEVIPLSKRFDPSNNDIRFSLAAGNTMRPSGLAANQPGTPVREMTASMVYQGESMQPAYDQAVSEFNKVQREGAGYAEHLAKFNEILADTKSKYFNMTPGAYWGLVIRQLNATISDPSADPGVVEEAMRQKEEFTQFGVDVASSSGQTTKGFDGGLRIANDPAGQVKVTDDLVPFNGSAVKRKEFDEEKAAVTRVGDKFTRDVLADTDEAELTRNFEKGLGDVARGEDASDAGEVEIEDVRAPDVAAMEAAGTAAEGWLKQGIAKFNTKVAALTTKWLYNTQLLNALNNLTGKFALPEEGDVPPEVAKVIAGITTKAERDAAIKKAKAEIEALTKQLTSIKSAKVSDEPVTSAERVEEMAVGRLKAALEKLVNPKAKKAMKVTEEKIAAAITSAILSKAGLGGKLPPGADNMVFATGLLLANRSSAANVLQNIHDIIQGDPDSFADISRDKLRAFMEVVIGRSFDTAEGASDKAPPYSEKQIASLLRSEIKRTGTSMTKIVKDAALSRTAPAALEAQIRDPKRPYANLLSQADLDKVVNAVMVEYNRTAAERVAHYKAQDARLEKLKAERGAAALEGREMRKEVNAARREAIDRKMANIRARRKARKAARSELIKARKAGEQTPTPEPLGYNETQDLLKVEPKRVIDYLAREFGFDVSGIVGMARGEDRAASLNAMVTDLARVLGLTNEQARKFMQPVIAEAMKKVDASRKKKAEKQIADAIKKKSGRSQKKGTVLTEAQKIIRLAELGGLNSENVEAVMLNDMGGKKFSEEFKRKLEGFIAAANDPNLPQAARDDSMATFVGMVKSARGVYAMGLWGEWTMSNIFLNLLSTLKVNAVWGGVKAISDSLVYVARFDPLNLNPEAQLPKGARSALIRSIMRGYNKDLQYQAAYILKTGRSKLESDYTTQFSTSDFETLAHFPDTEIRLWQDGKPLSPAWAKHVKLLARFSKYTRRTMVGTDIFNRTPAYEMLKTNAIIKLIHEREANPPTTKAGWAKAIDDALYGGDFEVAKANAKKEVARLVANGSLKEEEAGIQFGIEMEKTLGKSLGLSETDRNELLDRATESAKRWTIANATEGILGGISNSLLNAVREVNGLKFLLPAIRMPIGAFSQGLDWSPVGFLRAQAIGWNKGKSASVTNFLFNRDGMKKTWNLPAGSISDELAVELRTKAMLGTAMMIGLYLMAAASMDDDEDEAAFYITGRGPEDPGRNKLWREKGNQPNMFRVKGVGSIRFQESPTFPVLAALGAWSDAQRYSKPGTAESDKIFFAITRGMSAFGEAAVLKNLADVVATATGGRNTGSGAQQAGQVAGRLLGVSIAPRIGQEVNQILYGTQDQKAGGWAARMFANVPFTPSLFGKPALNFFGEVIHEQRGGPPGELFPMLAHRLTSPLTDDEQMRFMSKFGANQLTTSYHFKDGTRVADDFDFMRQWQQESGKKLRTWLTPEKMAKFEKLRAKDVQDAEKEFDDEVRAIRKTTLKQISNGRVSM